MMGGPTSRVNAGKVPRGLGMAEVKVGLQDVVIATSSICSIDGQGGKLTYRGYDIHDLAQHSSF